MSFEQNRTLFCSMFRDSHKVCLESVAFESNKDVFQLLTLLHFLGQVLLSLCLSFCLCLSVCLSLFLCVCVCVCVCVCLSVGLSVSVCLSVCLFVSLSLSLSLSLSFLLTYTSMGAHIHIHSVCQSVYLSFSLSLSLFFTKKQNARGCEGILLFYALVLCLMAWCCGEPVGRISNLGLLRQFSVTQDKTC